MRLTQLKPEAMAARRAVCKACPHALAPASGWIDKKFFCARLFDGDWGNRNQAAYLSALTADPVRACPDGRWSVATAEDLCAAPPPRPGPHAFFHALWDEIHNPARRWTPEYWESVLARLRGIACPCAASAQAYAEAHPIPFGDDAACWEWGVTFHDAVNVRKGLPEFGLDRAREQLRR